MAAKLGLEAHVVIKELARRAVSQSEIARKLGVQEGTVRYHLRRMAIGAIDGRLRQTQLAVGWQDAIEAWLAGEVGKDGALNLAALHTRLVEEHQYPGSLRSLQRYFRRAYPPPPRRARRRVETPPGAQGQADWAEFPAVRIGGAPRALHAFHLQLSFSRFGAVVWAEREDQVSWLAVHNGALRRLGGVPAVVRIDNAKTAIARGAGAWGELQPTYRRYAETVRFHVEACPPRAPEYKGKIERRIRDHRFWADPSGRDWTGLAELQAWTDERTYQSARRRVCPATGTSVLEAWRHEKAQLAPLPLLPEPFDVVVTRPVNDDCLVSFEGRQYSVPFRYLGRRVEIRGCAGRVQVLADGDIIAEHPRHTAQRILLETAHYEGPSTPTVQAPTPLGRMGTRLAALAALAPEQRPVDLYAALAEVAR